MALSIVIPIFNEEKYIGETIEVLKKLLGGKLEFEIIAVNNGSTDATAEILARTEGIHLINLPAKVTVSKARNAGWRSARNSLVAFIDGDMIIAEDWAVAIQQLDASVAKDALLVTGCKCFPAREPSWIENIWFKNENYRHHKEKYINSGNLITTQSVLTAIDGFDEALITGEDVDFCVRAQVAGAALEVDKRFKIYHEGYPKTLKQFIRRERWHGVGDLYSFAHFAKSKVAVLSTLVALLLIAAFTLLVFGQILFAVPLLLAIFLVVASAHYKFKVKSKLLWLQIYVLQMFYFIGRAMSIFIRNKI